MGGVPLSPFASLSLLPRGHTQGWEAIPTEHTASCWVGGCTRERLLLRQHCLLKPWAPPPANDSLQLLFLEHGFDRTEWARRCAKAAEALRSETLKLVLARPSRWRVSPHLSTRCLAESLLGRLDQPGCARLHLACPEESWIAATPEVLFQRQGTHLQTEALAGTLRSRADPAAVERSLLSCPLRRQEVELTAQVILQRLQRLGAQQIRAEPLRVRHYRDWSHLQIPIEADVTGIADEALLRALHPTPAVCGTPSSWSAPLRRRIEGPTRGWYAGALGISTPDWAHFVVVLRCAHLRDCQLTTWAGVGLVAGFDPATEWEELNVKLSSWLRLSPAGTAL